MKAILLSGFILFTASTLQAQINAITETGDEVILYEDGTWSYTNENFTEATEIPVNNKEFTKDALSTFLVKSKKFNIGVWIDPKKWSFTKGEKNEDSEFEFQMKGEDLYAISITEKIQIPLETLKGIAIDNAKSAAQNIKVVKEEYRTVNGVQVLMLQMSGNIQGLEFMYYGYYYSNPNGTIQLLTYTGKNLFKGYKDEIELFLNGFVEL